MKISEMVVGLRNVFVGIALFMFFIALFMFFIAFCMWLFRPIDGYFKPVFDAENGRVESVWYVRTSWWGLSRKEYPVEFNMGHPFYQIDGRSIVIEEWKYEVE